MCVINNYVSYRYTFRREHNFQNNFILYIYINLRTTSHKVKKNIIKLNLNNCTLDLTVIHIRSKILALERKTSRFKYSFIRF